MLEGPARQAAERLVELLGEALEIAGSGGARAEDAYAARPRERPVPGAPDNVPAGPGRRPGGPP